MTELKVENDTVSGVATIEISGLTTSDTRFRLCDLSADKYLGKRGWTKQPANLPATVTLADDHVVLKLDPDTAGRIAPRTSLTLEQSATGFRETFVWPEGEVPSLSIDEMLPLAPIPTLGLAPSIESPLESARAEPFAAASNAPQLSGDPEQEKADDEEPPHTRLPGALYDEPHRSSSWLLTSIAAGLFFVLGSALTYLWFDSKDASRSDSLARAAEVQRAQIAELSAARDSAQKKVTDGESALRNLQQKLTTANAQITSMQTKDGNEIDARIAELAANIEKITADRDEAVKSATEKEDQVKQLEDKLTAANAEIQTARQQLSEAENAQKAALSEKTGELSTQLEKTRQELAERESLLRDIQAKLSVANVQIDALKGVAGKATETGLEKTALEEKIAKLTTDLDAAANTIAENEKAAAEANQRLKTSEAKLAAVLAERDKEQAQVPSDAPVATAEQLKKERDVYAQELEKLTGNFTILKKEKVELEQQLAVLKQQGAPNAAQNTDTAQSNEQAEIAASAWGATAIDDMGAIYSANNQPSEKAARNSAAAKCRGQGYDCKSLATYQNSCFSVARFEGEGPANDNYAYSVHTNWRRSAAEALSRCERMGQLCTVRFTACSPNSLAKPVNN